MRTALFKKLEELMEKDKNIYLLTGDLGYSVFEPIQKKFPDRFINCGVAEQNMIGVAAGLAMEGKKVYVYSIIPFLLFRPFEFIRNDICFNNLDVNLIGVGGENRYRHLGFSHQGDKDLIVLGTLPNIMVHTPLTSEMAERALMETYHNNKPSYIRL